ncbi:hypothetical protein [Negadavirga shengliensis]|uniref:Uncharacterized protein n=1 Tax=Negadavirga shengliensis TaxID=1389218 RepID=A0ABV9T718_9BACT
MFKNISLGPLLLLLLMACVDEDTLPPGTQLMLNPHISLSHDSVFPWTANKSDGIELGVSKEVFMTGIQSLFIENRDSVNLNYGSWTQTYSGPMPAQGSTLELIAFLKGENISSVFPTSPRVYISFRIFPQSDSKGNTQGRSAGSDSYSFLEGDFDWTPIIITLDNFPSEADNISVNLGMLSGTTGKIYFDEITLTVK